MPAKPEQSWFKRFFASRLFLIAVLAVVMFIAVGYARAYYQDKKIRDEIAALEIEVRNLETKKIESLEILDYVTSDDFIEEQARKELNMKKPGENIVIIDQSHQVPDVQERASADQDYTHLNNLTKWWYYFTHKQI